MACRIIRSKETDEILSVMAANGQPSILYRDILTDYNDKEIALKKYFDVLTPDVTPSNLDANGEPIYIREEITLQNNSNTRTELNDLAQQLREKDLLDNNDFNCS